jgi:hypothetical protein
MTIDISEKLAFLDNSWLISISKIPRYAEFKELFTQPLDYHLCKLLLDVKHKKITDLMKQEFEDKVMKSMNKNTGILKVQHNNRHNIGRFYGNDNCSIIPQSRYFKHTLFSYLGWLDLDMVKGHASIACCYGNAIGLDFKHMKFYTNNFDTIADELVEFYSLRVEGNEPVTKGDIKYFFNMMIYGGGFSTWKKELAEGDPKNGVEPKFVQNENIMHPIAENYKKECNIIAKKIFSSNPSLARKVKKVDDTKEDNKRSTVSYWFQVIENHIVHICYQFLVKKRIIEKGICGLEYDGLCIPPTPFPFDKNSIVDEINDLILNSTGLPIKMKFKDYDPDFVLTDLIQKRKDMVVIVYEDEKVEDEKIIDSLSNCYELFKELYPDFEKTHCKITDTGNYASIAFDNTIIVRGDGKFRDSYKHIQCGFWKGLPKAFVDLWMSCNDKIRRFDFMNIYPNNSLCPSNAFNLWRPFAMELYTLPFLENEKSKLEVQFILNHIKILCDNDVVVYNYLINWIAQMIQFPEVKTVVVTMISSEGAGKGTLMKLFGKMLGKKKILETSTPSRDVFGSFNSMMSDYFLINLNELSKSETKGSEGQFKQMVTDGNLTINAKGVAQYQIDSYHRFFITTNNPDPITTKKDDRRNLIIRSSDEKIGDKDYFEKMNEYLEDDNIIKGVYQHFKSIENMEKFGLLPLPVTNYHNNLKEGNRDILDQWLEEYTFQYRNFPSIEKTATECFNDFISWRELGDIKYEINKPKFGVKLNTIARDCITSIRSNSGMSKIFDIVKLRIKYMI